MSRLASVSVSAVLAATLMTGYAGPQRETPPERPGLPLSTEDFPPLDSRVAGLQQRGLTAKLAARRLVAAPADPETVELLAKADRIDDAFAVLRRIVESHPDRIEAAFEIVSERSHEFVDDDAGGHPAILRQITEEARSRLAELPRERAARIAYVLVPVEGRLDRMLDGRRDTWAATWAARLGEFVEEYEGTRAALLARVDLIVHEHLVTDHDLPAMVEALDEFARAHRGTIAGAKALYQKGSELGSNYATTGVVPRDSDPTERFMEVVEIVDELESGAYPPCEWVDEAPRLIVRFYTPEQAVYAPENIDRMLAAYQRFVDERFQVAGRNPVDHGIGYVISDKMAELYALRGDEVAGVEGAFDELERSVDRDGTVRYLKARYYVDRWDSASAGERPALLEKAVETLSALAEVTDVERSYARKALATLGTLHTYHRNHRSALEAYRRYLDSYPRSDWAWVAALRTGWSLEALGRWQAALDVYRDAVDTHGWLAPAAVLGYVHAALASRALSRFDEALRAYRDALESWDHDFGRSYSLSIRYAPEPGRRQTVAASESISRLDLAARVAMLERSLAHPGGSSLERGRWLLEQERRGEARSVLARFGQEHPRSPLARDARYLGHRARLEHALEMGDIENPARTEAAARAGLDSLSTEPWDFAVGAAGIARAALMWKAGESAAARTTMEEALRTWHSNQVEHLPEEPATELWDDVTAIRNLVFRPDGDGIYQPPDPRAMWNAHVWPEEPPPFVVLDPRILVELPDGDRIEVPVHEPVPGVDDVLFLPFEQRRFLVDIIDKLGGTRKRQPRAIMETPNQPTGPSLAILDLWNEFFPARQGHWSGWVFETYPIIRLIEFVDEERTEARVPVTIGYAGATVLLEKREGEWRFVDMTGFWIT